jgi:hypothetical protein
MALGGPKSCRRADKALETEKFNKCKNMLVVSKICFINFRNTFFVTSIMQKMGVCGGILEFSL